MRDETIVYLLSLDSNHHLARKSFLEPTIINLDQKKAFLDKRQRTEHSSAQDILYVLLKVIFAQTWRSFSSYILLFSHVALFLFLSRCVLFIFSYPGLDRS